MKTFSVSRRVVFVAVLTLAAGITTVSVADTSRESQFREARVQRQQVIERTQNFRRDSNRNLDSSLDRQVDRTSFARQRQVRSTQVQRDVMIAQTRDFRRDSNRVRNREASRRNWNRDDRRREYRRDWDRRGHRRYYYGSRYGRYRYYGHRPYYGGYWGYPYYSYGWGPWWGPSFGVTVGGVYPYGGYYDGDVRIYRGEQVSPAYNSSIEFAVQRRLAKLGYYRGRIDGDIGPASRRAIRRYQQDNDLDVTGRIDRDLIASLGIT